MGLMSMEAWAVAKIFYASVAVPPAPVQVPSQRPLASSVTSVANDKSDNEIILRAVHRSEENHGKPQLEVCLMKGLCDQSSPQMETLNSICRIAQQVRKGEGRKE